MKIGIDIYGVILDYEKGMLAAAEIFDIENCRGNGKVNPDKFFVQDKFDWSKEEKDEFINKNLGRVSEESNIMPEAKYVLNKLKEMGHQLIIISARGTESDDMIDIVTRKFKKEGIEFDKYYWKEHNKVEVCKNEEIDIMIDDSPSTCKKMMDNYIKTLYFRGMRSWKIEENEYLKEVFNWGEVYRYIKEL